ncbi:MAG: hypothetical protein WA705_25730 [Candidatus Ozemobacteraceae bacterium]
MFSEGLPGDVSFSPHLFRWSLRLFMDFPLRYPNGTREIDLSGVSRGNRFRFSMPGNTNRMTLVDVAFSGNQDTPRKKPVDQDCRPSGNSRAFRH